MIDLFSVFIEEHLTDCGIVVIHVLKGTVARETVARSRTPELDVRLCEEVVLGLITCVGEGLVSRPHLHGEVAQGILLVNLCEVEG